MTHPFARLFATIVAGASLLVACGGSSQTASDLLTPVSVIPTAANPVPTQAAPSITNPTSRPDTVGPLPTATRSAPTPTSALPTVRPTSVPTTAASTILVVTGTGTSGLKLRETPNGKTLAVLREGTPLIALGDQQVEGNYTWLHVRSASKGEGWVASSFVAEAHGTPGTPFPLGTSTPA